MKPSAMTTCSSLSIDTIGQKPYPLNKGNPCPSRVLGPLSCSTYRRCSGMRRTCLESTHEIKSVPRSQGPTAPRWNWLWCYDESSTRHPGRVEQICAFSGVLTPRPYTAKHRFEAPKVPQIAGSPRSFSFIRSRARASRLLTVPMGTCSASAASV